MIYVTTKQSPKCHQMTLEELLFAKDYKPAVINYNETNTKTNVIRFSNAKMRMAANLPHLMTTLTKFNLVTQELQKTPKEDLYNTFYVPKKNKGMPHIFKQIFAEQKRYMGVDTSALFRDIGQKVRLLLSEHPTNKDDELIKEVVSFCVTELTKSGFKMTEDRFLEIIKESHRRIDAPCSELKTALYNLKGIFEKDFGALYHTSAFAYIKGRSTIDAIKRHQANESKWFAKFDLSNFFGSTTVDFIIKMFSMIFPFSEIIEAPGGKEAMEKALSLCVLNGVLPQGTPISPLITNIMMIPIDHMLSNELREFNKQTFIYTRYADDFLISSRYDFDVKKVESFIEDTLKSFGAPFTINKGKTRYGSSSGANWNLGVMLNRENKITVGNKKKRQFQAMLSSYIMDRRKGVMWDKADLQTLEGYRNYYSMVEGEVIDKIIKHIGQKFNADITALLKKDLRALSSC